MEVASLPARARLSTLREVNADANRARDTLLPGNEPSALKHLHHLIDSRCRDEEMFLNVRLGRRPAKAGDVFRDKREVLPLSLRGLGGRALCRSMLRLIDRGHEFVGASFHHQSFAAREVNAEPLLPCGGGVREGFTAQAPRERFGGQDW